MHATSDAADSLIESCGNIQAMTKDIYAPEFGQSVQIGQQTSSFSISISDELLASLRMSRVRIPHHISIYLSLTNHSSRTTKLVS